MGLDIKEENIQKRLAKRRERVEAAKEMNDDMYFYYLREKDRNIFGGVCLKKANGVWCRGISLLSSRDRLDKAAAKRYAKSRLMTAVMSKGKGKKFQVNPVAHESSAKLKQYYPEFFVEDRTYSGSGNTVKWVADKAKYNASLTINEKRTVGE